jgi:hypothetical protein
MRAARPLHAVAGIATLGLLLTACSAPDTGQSEAAGPAATDASAVPETPSAPVDL